MSIPEGERRLLIDGKLVESEGGGTFDNVNPATEEVLGPVADGTAADMEAAVAAARRAFDTTGWADDHDLRRRCLLQLQAAIEEEPATPRSRVSERAGDTRSKVSRTPAGAVAAKGIGAAYGYAREGARRACSSSRRGRAAPRRPRRPAR